MSSKDALDPVKIFNITIIILVSYLQATLEQSFKELQPQEKLMKEISLREFSLGLLSLHEIGIWGTFFSKKVMPVTFMLIFMSQSHHVLCC